MQSADFYCKFPTFCKGRFVEAEANLTYSLFTTQLIGLGIAGMVYDLLVRPTASVFLCAVGVFDMDLTLSS